jgi:hypothetical protein
MISSAPPSSFNQERSDIVTVSFIDYHIGSPFGIADRKFAVVGQYAYPIKSIEIVGHAFAEMENDIMSVAGL